MSFATFFVKLRILAVGKSKKIVYFALAFAENDEKTLVPDIHISAFRL